MRHVQLIALRPLKGDYGHVQEGQSFRTDKDTAEALEARGLVYRDRSKSVQKEEKKSWSSKLFGWT